MAMRDWFIKDLGWKFFSLFLAVAVWLTIYKIRGESETVPPIIAAQTLSFTNVPVLIVSSAADVRAFRVEPAQVTVTVSGPGKPIASLEVNQVRAYVDLENIASTTNLQRQVDVSVPPGLTPVQVSPAQVQVLVPPAKP